MSYRDQHQKLIYEALSKISPKATTPLLLNRIFLNCIEMDIPICMYLRFCLHLCRHQPEEYEASQSMESQLPHKGWLQIHHPQIQDKHGRSQKPQAAPFPCQNCKEKQVIFINQGSKAYFLFNVITPEYHELSEPLLTTPYLSNILISIKVLRNNKLNR